MLFGISRLDECAKYSFSVIDLVSIIIILFFTPTKNRIDEIKKQGFEKPSPIQSQAWPVLLKGEDLIGIAQTGTGKTLAFLLPAMIHTEFQSVPRGERGGPNVLVLAPTRELALQIEKEVGKYQFRGMKA